MAERIKSARRAAAAPAPDAGGLASAAKRKKAKKPTAPAAAASAPAPGIYYAAPTAPPPAAPAPASVPPPAAVPSPKRTKKTPSMQTTSVGTCPLAPAAPRGGALPPGGLVVAIHESGGDVSRYLLPTKAKLSTIFNSHAIGKRVPVDSLTFFLDGSRIEGDQTPEDLGLEPGDRIDCVRD